MSVSSLWLGILVGRMAAAVVLKYMCEYALICWCLALGAIAESALLLARAPVPGLGAAFAVGLFFGPVWPTIVSRAGSAYPTRTGLVTAIVVSVGSLGAAIFPALIGASADIYGLRPALWICVVLVVINFGAFVRLRARNHSSR
jgi:FHS family glucose/mannose:H+ symporter-like MFS transporter